MVLLCVRFLWVEARPRRLALGLGLLAAASVLQLVLLDATTGMPTHLLAWSPWLGAGVPAVIATAWLVTAPADQSPAAAAGPWPAALGALAALTMLAGLHVHVVDPVARPRIVLYGANEGPILDWKKPRFGEYGPYSMGMFGLLPDYLAKDGFEVGHLDESITPERLVGADVLVLINVNARWSEDELLAVWTFVQDGGSLLVLGDHTNVENSRGSLNDVLAPFGIEFEFDSAFPASPSGWLQSILYPHQALARVERPDQLGISIGASLRLSHAGALPLVVGRHGLADAGDSSAVERAYLGDYRYRRGEPLGDLVLAAWRRFGAGRVVVFGDTSGFQNTVLERTWDPFVRDLFAWLGGDVRIDLGLAGSVVLGILFLLSSLAAVAQARDRALLLGGIVLALWCTSVVGLASLGGRLQRPASNVPRILIDMSHLQRLAPSLDGERDLDGFRNTALRSGYVVDILESLSERGLEGASMLVTVAPRRPYTTREVALLGRFMERGGFVLACASQPQSAGLRELLDLVGLQVLPRPVGSIPLDRAGDRVRDRVEYLDAWQVGPMESPAPDEPWVYGEFEGLPLAMLARHGQGGLFLVGDSRFFSSANLEHGTSVSEPNIHFLRALFADVEAFRSEVRR